MSIIVKANRFYIDLVYVLIDIRRFVFLTVVLLLFSACQSVRDSGAADNSNGISTNTPKNSPTVSYALEFIVDGFQKPIYVTHAGDGTGRLFVVEQSGVIWIVMDGQVFNEPFLDLSNKITRRSSEQGLLGLAFDPNYSNNGQFFVHYSDNNGDTVVKKLFVSGNANRANHQSGIKVLTQSQPYRNHNGGQIAFGPDGNLYVGLGDGGL
ncbi:MAG TPA: hypothetical protein DGN60_03250, partial [Chloroflexi bacterium]|nr:hypothetical protein [Chloroflexota bacterium]